VKTIKRKKSFPSWANYIAKDSDGDKWFYAYMPGLFTWKDIKPYWLPFDDSGNCLFYKYGNPTNKPEKKIWKIVD
jgi:hypothetical protein